MIRAVIFDFGGVLAEEGFKEGTKAIARENGLDPDVFFRTADDLIYQTGYVLGLSDESYFWKALRERTGIIGTDRELREEILKRFVLRHAMISHVEKIISAGLITAILSDQTNWLDEINQRTPFFHHFDHIFNSYHLKKGKRDASLFRDVCSEMGISPDEAVFVDDNIENIKRASAERLKIIHFKNIDEFERELNAILYVRSS
ncbi:MAG: HAD family phosphatase [Nitrospirae bacterium]|nr:HAD family phosphatase [Nitrospirota bacterium]